MTYEGYYISIVPLILAMIGGIRGKNAPHRMYLIIIALFALAFAFGNNFIVFPLFYHIPLFVQFRGPVP